MTSPVKVEFGTSAQGPFCKQNFTVSFYLPREYWEDPPQPRQPEVFLASEPERVVYVAQAGGFKMDGFSVSRMLKSLLEV